MFAEGILDPQQRRSSRRDLAGTRAHAGEAACVTMICPRRVARSSRAGSGGGTSSGSMPISAASDRSPAAVCAMKGACACPAAADLEHEGGPATGEQLVVERAGDVAPGSSLPPAATDMRQVMAGRKCAVMRIMAASSKPLSGCTLYTP